MEITRESLDLASEDKDHYKEHRDKLVEVVTSHGLVLGKYFGIRNQTREIVLFPSLAWTTNQTGEPVLEMNYERPRYLNLQMVDNIGPVDEKYVAFYQAEQLKQFRKNKAKLDRLK